MYSAPFPISLEHHNFPTSSNNKPAHAYSSPFLNIFSQKGLILKDL